MKKLGKYELLKEIGRSDQTIDYEARDSQIGRLVGLSMFTGATTQGDLPPSELAKLFISETFNAAGLFHPHLIPVYDYGHIDGVYFRTARLTDGSNLRQVLDEKQQLPLEQVVAILAQLADAQEYLASQMMVCQDLKLTNVVLEGDPAQPFVSLVNLRLRKQEPEKSTGHRTHVDDLFSLAFETLSGRPLSQSEMATLVTDQSPASISQTRPELDHDLVDILMPEGSSTPADRYATPTEFVAALRQVADARQDRVRQISGMEQILAMAHTAQKAGEWLSVQALAIQILQQDPSQSAALNLMAEATAALQQERIDEARRQQTGKWYEEGERALAAGDWTAAAAAFAKVARVEPHFRDVENKLAQATREIQFGQWHEQAMSAANSGKLAVACRLWFKVLNEEPGYLDGRALRSFMDLVGRLLDAEQLPDSIHQEPVSTPIRPFHEPSAIIGYSNHAEQQADEIPAATERLSGSAEQTETWVDRLARMKTQRLGNGDGAAQSLQDERQSVNTVRKQASRQDKLPVTGKLPDDPKAAATWLERLATQQTKRLLSNESDSFTFENSDRRVSTINWAKDGKTMVRVPEGPFVFGPNKVSKSVHEFWIDKTPVTNAEYKLFLDANPTYPVPYDNVEEAKPHNWDRQARTYPKDMAGHPVVLVSWMDAATYASWARKRLPTEEEWEKAARGLDGREFPWGRTWSAGLVNTQESGIGDTTAVGKFSPAGDSPYGAVDMCGNVWEWTASDFSRTTKVLRGGSWRNSSINANCTWRSRSLPATAAPYIGFRLVSSTPTVP